VSDKKDDDRNQEITKSKQPMGKNSIGDWRRQRLLDRIKKFD
jgi:hypothetical protein